MWEIRSLTWPSWQPYVLKSKRVAVPSHKVQIPYLNWATEAERDKLNHIIHIVSEEYKSGTSPDETAIAAKTDRYEKLLWAYLYNDHPLHVRRTLDQSYYSTLQDTRRRDSDQVPKKYIKKTFPGIKAMPVLMVDQLWAWILDDRKFSFY